jgi:hypothetical protein
MIASVASTIRGSSRSSTRTSPGHTSPHRASATTLLKWRRLRVLVAADGPTPLDGLALLAALLDRDVGHEAGRRGAVQWFSPGSKKTPSSMHSIPTRPGLVLGYGAIPTTRVTKGLRRLRRCFHDWPGHITTTDATVG